MVSRDTITTGSSTDDVVDLPSQTAALWRAITRGHLSEAQRLLLALPAGRGATFQFDDVSVLTGVDPDSEGTSPIAMTPTAQGWASPIPVSVMLFSPETHCGGIPNFPANRNAACFKVCALPRTGREACPSVTHRSKQVKFDVHDLVWGILYPASSRAASTKPCIFSRPLIPHDHFPDRYDIHGGYDCLTALRAPSANWMTAFEAIPPTDVLARWLLAVETVTTAGGEEETKDDFEEEDEDEIIDLAEDTARGELAPATIESLALRLAGLEAALSDSNRETQRLREELDQQTELLETLDLREGVHHASLQGRLNAESGGGTRDQIGGEQLVNMEQRLAGNVRATVENEVRQTRTALQAGLRRNTEDLASLQSTMSSHDFSIRALDTDMRGSGGRVELLAENCKKMEARADRAAVEMGGEIFRSEEDVAAFLLPLTETEVYRLVADFNVLLHLIPDPYADFEGAMAVENARTKANYGSVLAARVMAAHQIRYPPLVLKGATSREEDSVTYRFAAGFKSAKVFTGTHNSGTKHDVLKNLKTVKAQLSKSIRRAFPPDRLAKAHSTLSDALARSCDQVKGWLDSIESFNNTLLSGGLTDEVAWANVQVYIKRLFDDVHEVRSTTSEVADEASIIWGSFCGHLKLEEYARYNFVEHPSVGAMLVLTVMEHEDSGVEGAISASAEALTQAKRLKQDVANLQRDVKTLKEKAK